MNLSAALRKARDHSEPIIAASIFLSAAALYLYTVAPNIGGIRDSSEFQHAAYMLEIVHATGYPLYLILGKLFTTLVPIGNIAYRMNVLSALLGAAAAVVFYLNARLLTRRLLASLSATAIFVTNVGVWRHSGVASVGPLSLILMGAFVYALLRWADGHGSLTTASFLFGLALAHHRSIIMLVPAIILLLLWKPYPFIRSTPRLQALTPNRDMTSEVGSARGSPNLPAIVIAFVLPLLFYLYLPLFGSSSPWYSNTLQGFINQTFGNPESYLRLTVPELVDATVAFFQFVFDSLSFLGVALLLLGLIAILRGVYRGETVLGHRGSLLFLAAATMMTMAFAIVFNSEQDRYFYQPFFFFALWFAVGAGTFERILEAYLVSKRLYPAASSAFAIALALLIVVPFDAHYRQANWSTYDREYKLWDEIFSLPLPPGATIVGDWAQLNDMRYMQMIEHRRPDITLVGSMYETEPQTQAAASAFADGRAIFLAPGIALPNGSYRYALLGPLLQVRDQPQTQAPETDQPPIVVAPALALVDYGIATALEPFAPTASVAPTRSVRANLTWRAEARLRDFLVRLRLYDPDRRLISQKDEAPVRGLYPPSNWEQGEYVSDVKNFLIPAGTPPGNYLLKMAVVDAETKTASADDITMGGFAVVPATNIPLDQVFMQHDFGDGIGRRVRLAGYGGLDGTHRPGERLSFYLVWSVHDKLTAGAQLRIALLDASGKASSAWTRAPIEFYPTEQWQPGERLKAYYDIDLPNDLAPGDYDFRVGIGQEPDVAVTRLHIGQ